MTAEHPSTAPPDPYAEVLRRRRERRLHAVDWLDEIEAPSAGRQAAVVREDWRHAAAFIRGPAANASARGYTAETTELLANLASAIAIGDHWGYADQQEDQR